MGASSSPCGIPRRIFPPTWTSTQTSTAYRVSLGTMNHVSSPQELLALRRARLRERVGRALRVPNATPDDPLDPPRRAYLLGEARDLYWNDLEWENVTEEERMEGGGLPELTFPGVLAFVRGLLLDEVMPDSPVGPSPRPEVVEEFLEFLAGRILDLREAAAGGVGEEGDRAALELRMTDGLLDRVLVTYHGIEPEDAGPLEET